MWVVVRYHYASSPQILASYHGLAKASQKAQELARLSTDKYENFVPRLESALVRRSIDDVLTGSGEKSSKKRGKRT